MVTDHQDPFEIEEFDRGLQYDLSTLINRRQALRALAGTSLLAIISCSGGGAVTTTRLTSPTTSAPTSTEVTTGAASTTVGATETVAVPEADCEVIPEETAGPFPGNGTNGPDVLTTEGVVRADITSSFGGMSGIATGVPLQIQITIQDQANGCEPYAGAAVYAWHCDAVGNYSLYSDGATDQNYLRGVQEADANGTLSFTSIFPACYSGRWPHIHFEVYPDLASATDASNKIATSQIALPADICEQIYAMSGYESSLETFPQVSLESDGVFGEDGGERQIGTMSGTVDSNLAVALAVPV
ncbi:intradiol ring-cleavage dioxygenase [soil metagenome]